MRAGGSSFQVRRQRKSWNFNSQRLRPGLMAYGRTGQEGVREGVVLVRR
jgi:hypothetical protein